MPIDPNIAVGADLGSATFSWSASDVQLYHLGVSVGISPLDAGDLRFQDDVAPQVLPTFATVAPTFHKTEPPKVSFPGIEIDLAKIVHGSQRVTVHRPLPAAGTATMSTKIVEVQDKGSAAVIIQESTTVDESGATLWSARSSIFAKGEGGFGGERGTSDKVEYPDREPDHIIDTKTLPQQALLYRLCGDRNPLHSDPEFATAAGFPAPILHGLCTYGTVCGAVVRGVLGGDVDQVAGFGAKFAGVVYPGETLRTRVWDEGGRLLITASVVERDDAPALANVVLERR